MAMIVPISRAMNVSVSAAMNISVSAAMNVKYPQDYKPLAVLFL